MVGRGQAHMYEQDRYSRGLGWIWALVVLIVVLLLLFGALRSGLFSSKQHDDAIYTACTSTYGRDNCSCFAGVLKMQLSEGAYQSYVSDLERDEYRLRYFDGRLAENSFIGRDADLCVEASDICKIPVCEPRYYVLEDNVGIGGAPPPQTPVRPRVGQPPILEQGS